MSDFIKRKLTRGDCLKEARPCRRHCPYRLDGAESCALDVADRGGLSRPEVAALLGVSKACIQDTEERAMRLLCRGLGVPLPAYADYALDLEIRLGTTAIEDRDNEVAQLLAQHGRSTILQLAEVSGIHQQVIRESLARLVAADRATRSKAGRVAFAYELAEEAEAAE